MNASLDRFFEPNRFSGGLGSQMYRACSEVWLSPEVSNLISTGSNPGGRTRLGMRSVHLCGCNRVTVRARQKLGVALMLLFMPINGPLWRMGLSSVVMKSQLVNFRALL